MPIPKLEITNPEAIELLEKIKTGAAFTPILNWFKKYRWYFVGAGVFLVLIIAMVIGKKIAEGTPAPIITPPDIESITPTEQVEVKSTFSGLKKEIQDLNTDLPDPFIPAFESTLDLEPSAL